MILDFEDNTEALFDSGELVPLCIVSFNPNGDSLHYHFCGPITKEEGAAILRKFRCLPKYSDEVKA